MEAYQARYFLAVSEERSFTRAARRCGVSQPSLSNGIKRLEMELGAPLFRREAGTVSLSELGSTLLPYVEQFDRNARGLCRQIAKLKQAIGHAGDIDGGSHALCAQTAASGADRRDRDFGGGNPGPVEAVIQGAGARLDSTVER